MGLLLTDAGSAHPKSGFLKRIDLAGFPSTSLDLATPRPNYRDPNGYYSRLGVSPSASIREIRCAYLRLARIYHPQGSHPDVDEFRYIRQIYHVLSDPKSRYQYNNAEKFLGQIEFERLKEEMQEGITDFVEKVQVPKDLTKDPVRSLAAGFYSYFGELECVYIDPLIEVSRAQLWYLHLLDVFHLHRVSTILRVAIVKDLQQEFQLRRSYNFVIFAFPYYFEANPFTALSALKAYLSVP